MRAARPRKPSAFARCRRIGAVCDDLVGLYAGVFRLRLRHWVIPHSASGQAVVIGVCQCQAFRLPLIADAYPRIRNGGTHLHCNRQPKPEGFETGGRNRIASPAVFC